jgi:prepilin-type processing-associated H-X9-DG protein
MKPCWYLAFAALVVHLIGHAQSREGAVAGASVERSSVLLGVLNDGGPGVEISTAELRKALEASAAVVLDARPLDEYSIGHIPGARAVPGKEGTTAALYTADVSWVRAKIADKHQALILYCNGLNCGRSKRFAEELLRAGYSNISRYQLGAPAWRALGGVMQAEKSALLRLLSEDRTALLIDARDAHDSTIKLRTAIVIGKGQASRAKDDGRLPMTDHNTRIFVVGDSGQQAREVAEDIVRAAFYNVAFFDGSVGDLQELHERGY